MEAHWCKRYYNSYFSPGKKKILWFGENVVWTNTKRKINYMIKIKFYKFILTISVLILLNFSSNAYSQNTDELYQKIDLFSEVLEKYRMNMLKK